MQKWRFKDVFNDFPSELLSTNLALHVEVSCHGDICIESELLQLDLTVHSIKFTNVVINSSPKKGTVILLHNTYSFDVY